MDCPIYQILIGKKITKINALGIEHFSAYALTVEPKTKLDYLIKSKKINAISDDKIVEQFKILQEKTNNMGFVNTKYQTSVKTKIILNTTHHIGREKTI